MTISPANPIQFWLMDELTHNQKEVDGITPTCYYQIFNASDVITNQFLGDAEPIGYDLQVLDASGNELGLYAFQEIEANVWQNDYIPSSDSPGVTDQLIQFKIIANYTSLPSEVKAQSDLVSIKVSHRTSVLMAYNNPSDYAGLFYSDISPQTTFYLRIPGVFFHEEPFSEQEDIELSDDTIVTSYNKQENKRKLEVGYVAYYMHQKIILALNHQFVTIDNKDWIRRDAYSIESGNKRYPLKIANVLLTDKEFIKRNLL